MPVQKTKIFPFSQAYIRRSETLKTNGDIDAALEILERHLEQFDDPQAWALYGETLLMSGREIAARAAFRCAVGRFPAMHVKDVIEAYQGFTVAIVDEESRLVYIPVAKAGSTTVKGWLSEAMFGETTDINAHEKMRRLQRVIRISDLSTVYREYFKFAVIRPAQERLSSYYRGNILTGMLKRDSWDRDEIEGLPTRPNPEIFTERFFDLRRVFPDFRNHTNRLELHLGADLSLYDQVYTMATLDECRSMLAKRYKREIAAARKMASEGDQTITLNVAMVNFYAAEADLFAQLADS